MAGGGSGGSLSITCVEPGSAVSAPVRTGAREATRSTRADSMGLNGFSSLGARFAILFRRSDL